MCPEVCRGLKEMRDGKLYKELGYKNFEEYTENEVGIKRVQAHNLAKIAEKLTPEFVQSIEQIGTTKLALLAQLDEPEREALTATVDVESTTVKQLQAEVARLKGENDRAQQDLTEAREAAAKHLKKSEQLDRCLTDAVREKQEITDQKRTADSDLRKARQHAAELERQVRELEERPVDVAVMDPSEHERQTVEALNAEWEDKLRQAEAEHLQRVFAVKDEGRKSLMAMQRRHEEELEQLRAEGGASEVAEAKLVVDAYTRSIADILDNIEQHLSEMDDEEAAEALYKETADWIRSYLNKIAV